MSLLYANTVEKSSFGQLYTLDFNIAKEVRLSHYSNSNFLESILDTLSKVLDEHNLCAQFYKNMHQKIKEEKELALKENRKQVELEMRFYNEPSADPR